MNISLDETTISAAIQTAASAAVLKGLSAWDLQETIAQSAKRSIEAADLPKVVQDQLDSALAKELEPLVAAAITDALPGLRAVITESIQSMSASMLYGLAKGRPSPYSQEDIAIWQDCLNKVRPDESKEPKVE
jgi:membrane carboxypeptidase/penicillin-binding protein